MGRLFVLIILYIKWSETQTAYANASRKPLPMQKPQWHRRKFALYMKDKSPNSTNAPTTSSPQIISKAGIYYHSSSRSLRGTLILTEAPPNYREIASSGGARNLLATTALRSETTESFIVLFAFFAGKLFSPPLPPAPHAPYRHQPVTPTHQIPQPHPTKPLVLPYSRYPNSPH